MMTVFAVALGIPVLIFLFLIGEGVISRPMKTAKQKVVEYAQTPSRALAQIIAGKIIAHPDNITTYREFWKCPEDKVRVRWNTYGREIRSLYCVQVAGKSIDFEKKEEDIIVKALKKATDMAEAQRAADAEAAKQMAALDAISSIMGIDKQETKE